MSDRYALGQIMLNKFTTPGNKVQFEFVYAISIAHINFGFARSTAPQYTFLLRLSSAAVRLGGVIIFLNK